MANEVALRDGQRVPSLLGESISTPLETRRVKSTDSGELLTTAPAIQQAINEIYSSYGAVVSVYEKQKSLTKFGRSVQVQTTASTIMTLPTGTFNETYVSTNIIDTISSSSSADTQTVTVEGHTISGSDLTFVVQNTTLMGQNKVTLATPLARMTRLYNTGSTNFAGVVYGYEDQSIMSGVPQTDSKVHLMVPIGTNQSEKASTSVSSTDYWIITSYYASLLNKTAAFADVQLQVRRFGSVFRTQADIGVSSGGGVSQLVFNPYLIAPANSDIRLIAIASANGTDVSGGTTGYLASVVS